MRRFFSNQLQAFVVDGMCECGELESSHCSKVSNIDGKIVRERGHGPGKHCCQFRWNRWVTEEEFERIIQGFDINSFPICPVSCGT